MRVALLARVAGAASLAQKARECRLRRQAGRDQRDSYKCTTAPGKRSVLQCPRRPGGSRRRRAAHAPTSKPTRPAPTPTPAGFPRVDADTQKGRDDLRRKVLSDELAAEEKLLAEARTPTRTARPRRCPRKRPTPRNTGERIARLRAGGAAARAQRRGAQERARHDALSVPRAHVDARDRQFAASGAEIANLQHGFARARAARRAAWS